MADGRWNTAALLEEIRQSGHMRGRPLNVYTGPDTDPAFGTQYASAYASFDPTVGSIPAPHNGPHFTLSPQTPDGRPTLGFEWCLLSYGVPVGTAVYAGDGFTVTVWKLIENLEVGLASAGSLAAAPWAAFEPVENVKYNELYRTFDCNACTIRFQLDNVLTEGGVILYVTEL